MATAADDLALRRLNDATRDAPRLQLETLRAILAENAGAAYLRRYIPEGGRLHSAADAAADAAAAADEFRRLVPVSTYDDYADTILRVADGDAGPDELSPRPLLCFFLSSGTSSLRPKLIPYLDSPGAKAASAAVIQANSALVRRIFPPRPTVSKALWFLYAGEVTETKGGYEAMAATAWGIRSSGSSTVLSSCVSPAAVIFGADHQQQLYCHLLCGLRWWDAVDCIRAPYAAGLVRAVRLLESKWQQLCDDIESGTVCAGVVTDVAMRGAVQDVLAGPYPELADRVRGICRREEWRGVLRDLWPEMRYISCVSTGTMEQYFPAIKYFAGATVPVLGTDYLASECPIGINVERALPPEETTYVLLPTAAYFEFIPFYMDDEGRSDGAETVDITGVEAGKTYEVVATTFRGLYRYRLGDVVKVAGFQNSSPRLQFVTRAPKEHSSEMFTERDVIIAMESFQLMLKEEEQRAGSEFIEFAAFIVSDDDNGAGRQRHAKIAVEVSKGSRLLDKERSEESAAFLRRCCTSLEGCLGCAYRLRRARGDVGALEIAVVSPRSFDRLAEAAMRSGAPANQYKPPKIVRHRHLVDVLESSVVCSSMQH